jgi:putative ABC transport system permease protein
MMTSILQDFGYSLRVLKKHPTFGTMVIATLALGIGANIAMFSVVNGVLLSSLPYRDAERLVMIWNRHVTTGADKVQVSGLDFLDYQERASTFEDFVVMHNSTDNALSGDGPAEQIDVGYVSGNFFQFLGREPILGRGFTKDDEVAVMGEGAPSPTIISHGLWTRRYGADPGILGRTIYVSNVPMEVVGVLPADFELIMPQHDGGATGGGASDVVHVWAVLPERVFRFSRSVAIFRVLGRLRDGVTFRQAQEEMDALAAQLRDEFRIHQDRNTQIDLVPMHADVVEEAKPVVLSLFGAVGFVLLIACANVANLILVRAAHRRREVAVRAALGADRTRLVRQLLTENAVLAVAGTALGLLLARVAIDAIVALAPSDVPLLGQIGIDSAVLWFAVGITGIAILLFGLVPAVRAAQPDLRAHLSDSPRAGSRSAHRLKSGIVVAEIALSLVLLVGGGLMIRSFLQLQGARLGFEPSSALTVKIALSHGPYDDPAVRTNYWTTLRREASSLPGVDSAAIVWPLPFAGSGAEVPYAADGGTSNDWGRYVTTVSSASPGYFDAMGARLLDGRTFTETDLTTGADIAVVDDIVAQRLFPGENAVGRTLWLQPAGDEKVPLEIVGVVGHIRHQSVIGIERETIFRPTAGSARMRMALVVRTDGDPLVALGGLRQIASTLDPNIPLYDVRTFDEYLGNEIAPTRFTMTLASAFAFVALVLASVGLYGVISYSVAQRASELGVRMALGAQHGTILRLVLRHGVFLAATGIGIGLFASLMLTRVLRSLLFGVTPTDPLTFVGVSLLLTAVALLASYAPARRAARLDPVTALRQ